MGQPRIKSGPAWFVYVLRCGDDSLYTGITTDVTRRCMQHNVGTASKYTRSRRPVTVVYREGQPSRGLALKREAAIKAFSKRQKESMIRQGSGVKC
jgi:predicted GIY-YIG superfamily endonuclease